MKKIEQIFPLSEFNLFRFSVLFHTETSYLICTSNQMTSFYMRHNARHSETFSYFLVLDTNARIQSSRIYLISNLQQSKMGWWRYYRVSLNCRKIPSEVQVCQSWMVVFNYQKKTCESWKIRPYPPNIYLFKVNNRNIGKRCEICSELTIKTHFSCVSIVDFKQVKITPYLVGKYLTVNKKNFNPFMHDVWPF